MKYQAWSCKGSLLYVGKMVLAKSVPGNLRVLHHSDIDTKVCMLYYILLDRYQYRIAPNFHGLKNFVKC